MDSERVKAMTQYDDHTNFNGKLKPEVKAEWLTLLRSEDTKQTAGTLRRLLKDNSITPKDSETYGYCCLGVLANMYVEKNAGNTESGENPLIKWEKPRMDGVCVLQTLEGNSDGMPTFDVNHWAFATGGSNGWYVYVDEADAKKYGRYLGDKNSVYLPQMNDGGATFVEIANVIEKYL